MASSFTPEDLDSGATQRGIGNKQIVFGGRFVLLEMLGKGGMGTVWRALDKNLDCEIALKFLSDELARDPQAREELKRETRRSRQLTHPNIVRIYDFEEEANLAAISMEAIAGKSLHKLKAARSQMAFSVAEIASWAEQLCEALAYAHNVAKVVHRDLKPANIMISKEGQVKMLDFGIAATVSESTSRLSRLPTENNSGTLLYMSPQQLRGEMSKASDDLYALGATLYELLAGKPPFFRGDVSLQILNSTVPSIAQRRKELEIEGAEPVPARWEETIVACLAKEREKRPVSATEVWARLGGKPVVAPPPRPKPDPGLPEPPKKSPRGKMLSVVGALVLAMLALGFYFKVYAPRQAAPMQKPSDTAVRVATTPAPQPAARTEPKVTPILPPPTEPAPALENPLEPKSARTKEPKSEPPSGTVVLTSNPYDAVVMSDQGALLGRTPLTLREVKPGAYHYAVGRDGYETANLSGEVTTGQILKLNVELEKVHELTEGRAWTVPNLRLAMIWIAPGEFVMGTPESEQDRMPQEGPQMRVKIAHGYWIGKYEVTQGEWKQLMGTSIQQQRDKASKGVPLFGEGDHYPMYFVSWEEADTFCKRLTEQERSEGRLSALYEYTLPTEAQWEYAGRAGTTGAFPADLDEMAWYNLINEGIKKGARGESQPVGTKKPNAWGLYDMLGNVEEYCRDLYTNNYLPNGDVASSNAHGTSLARPSGNHVVRGGDWGTPLHANLRLGRRMPAPPMRSLTTGFRVALSRVNPEIQMVALTVPVEAKPKPGPAESKKTALSTVTSRPTSGEPLSLPELGLDLMPIAAGSFTMGGPSRVEALSPHEVTLSEPFWLGRTEITQRQWQTVMGKTVAQQNELARQETERVLPGFHQRELPLPGEGGDYPIYFVSWLEAMEFCQRLTERERAGHRLPEGYVYTLPSEAEWEYACRAGAAGELSDDEVATMAWCLKRSGVNPPTFASHEVAQNQPNAWGLYDMLGNVDEWCRNWEATPKGGAPSVNSVHAVRGGHWGVPLATVRPTMRTKSLSNLRSRTTGFRIALVQANAEAKPPPPTTEEFQPGQPPATAARTPTATVASFLTTSPVKAETENPALLEKGFSALSFLPGKDWQKTESGTWYKVMNAGQGDSLPRNGGAVISSTEWKFDAKGTDYRGSRKDAMPPTPFTLVPQTPGTKQFVLADGMIGMKVGAIRLIYAAGENTLIEAKLVQLGDPPVQTVKVTDLVVGTGEPAIYEGCTVTYQYSEPEVHPTLGSFLKEGGTVRVFGPHEHNLAWKYSKLAKLGAYAADLDGGINGGLAGMVVGGVRVMYIENWPAKGRKTEVVVRLVNVVRGPSSILAPKIAPTTDSKVQYK